MLQTQSDDSGEGYSCIDASNSHKGRVARKALVGINGMEVGTGGGPALEILVAECDGLQHLDCIEGGRP